LELHQTLSGQADERLKPGKLGGKRQKAARHKLKTLLAEQELRRAVVGSGVLEFEFAIGLL
jgi:hypothetical protein